MEIEEKIKALLGKMVKVLTEDPELSEAVLPTLAVAISAATKSQLDDHMLEEPDKYLYHLRAFDDGGKPCAVTVDYDLMPYLSIMDSMGSATWGYGTVLVSAKEEDNKPEVLH